jgi:A/G-specific adenine glycosylase
MRTKKKSLSAFSKRLIAWYKKNKRDLPWRRTRDPYPIWLSEIILQQTRVEQGLPYYESFIRAFPAVENLSRASEKKIMKLWQGLGYYSRARNLHATSKKITRDYNGKFPDDYSELLRLKGIGEYTASAIASFAFGKPTPVVDGNVFRVLSRLFGVKTPIDSPKAKKEFRSLAFSLMDKKNPGDFNQAIMEFGALQCKPVSPLCATCPFHAECRARKTNRISSFPVKSKKTSVRERFIHYFVFRYKGSVMLHYRKANDIWKGLYDFPSIETDKKIPPGKITGTEGWKKQFALSGVLPVPSGDEFRHLLSHRTIVARFYELELSRSPYLYPHLKKFICVPVEKVKNYAVSRLVEKYLFQCIYQNSTRGGIKSKKMLTQSPQSR